MRTYDSVKLGTITEPSTRDALKKIDDYLRSVSGALSKSVFPGQQPPANPVPTGTSSTPPPPGAGIPQPVQGDLLYGLNTGTWAKLGIGATGSVLNVSSGTPVWSTVLSLLPVHDHSNAANGGNIPESSLSLSDITTNNVTIGRHGFVPKAPNDAAKYLDGSGAYSVPAGSVTLPIAETDISDGTLLARVADDETITGNWTFGTGGWDKATVIESTDSGSFDSLGLLILGSASTSVKLCASSGLASDINVVLPVADGQLVDVNGSTVLANKTLGSGCKLRFNATGATSSSILTDSASATKVGAYNLSGITAGNTRLQGWQDLSGTIPLVGNDPPAVAAGALGKVDLTAQVANIATTNLSSTPPAGLYRVEAILMTTTGAAAAGTLTMTIGWTDTVGATTSTPIAAHSLVTTGRTAGSQLLRVASGDISYAVAVTGIYSTSAYAVYVRVTALG